MAVCCLASNHKMQKKASEKIDNYFAENPDEAIYSLEAIWYYPFVNKIM